MLDDGEKLVPGFRQARALRVWTGVRPLFEDAKESDTDTRDVTRAHALLDHEQRDGVRGFVTITGGKLTTYRMMAEETVDAVCQHLGDVRPCTTKTEPLPGSESGADLPARRAAGAQGGGAARRAGDLRVRAGHPRAARGGDQALGLDQARRHPPAAAARHGPLPGRLLQLPRDRNPARASTSCPPRQANQALLDFMQERWKGIVADPVRRPAAPGPLRRLGVPGCARRRARARHGAAAPSGAARRSPRCDVMRSQLHFDAVVIGGGTAGLTAGTRLAAGRGQGRGAGQGPRLHASVAGHDRRARLHPGTGRRSPRDSRGPPDLRATGSSRTRWSAPRRSRSRWAGSPTPPRTGRCPATATSAAWIATCCCRPRWACCDRRRWSPRRWRPARPSELGDVAIVSVPALREFHPSLCAANLSAAGIPARADQPAAARWNAPT